MGNIKLDEIGYWSEIKLDIIKEYASAYSKIMNRQSSIKEYYYIDGFAGAGIHISKTSNEFVLGSPAKALNITPSFNEFHFIDLDGSKAEMLSEISKSNKNVAVYEGDCNKILLDRIFPLVMYEDYKRAICLLDPYGLHLDWEVMKTAGQLKTIEIFLNFPVMDMNMNVLWSNPNNVTQRQKDRMNFYWGDDSWREAAYNKEEGLFDIIEEKATNEVIAEAFRERLERVACFRYVPMPMPMRNTKGAIVYYLFFASPNKTGAKIINDIFAKYRDRGI